VVVLLDAKRSRVYTAVFERRGDRYVGTGKPVEADPVRFLREQRALGGSCAVLGEGVHYHRPAVEASSLPVLAELLFPPRAETVYRLGVIRAAEVGFADRRALIPTYVRPPEAEEKWKQRHQAR
jgi:tRNA A37 threonylcarbamoyladenosine modification protein TsaB